MKRRDVESRLRAMRLVEPRPELRDAVMASAERSRHGVPRPRTAQWPGRRFWLSWATAMLLVVAGEVVQMRGVKDRQLAAGTPVVADRGFEFETEPGEEIPRWVLAWIERTDEPARNGDGSFFRDEAIASSMR